MDNIIEVKNVTYEYTDEEKTFAAVKNLSLNIERGSFTVILGHNGSGKSTLAKMLNGLNKPTSGDVFADGINTKDATERSSIRVAGSTQFPFLIGLKHRITLIIGRRMECPFHSFLLRERMIGNQYTSILGKQTN